MAAPNRSPLRAGWLLLAGTMLAASAQAQGPSRSVPLSDTEDASLGTQAVGGGRLHPVIGFDLRNGDFVRGSYDDDGAGIGRLPAHAQLGLVYEFGRRGGEPSTWLELRSSNGFHAPREGDHASPRAWYESNNLVGVATRVAAHATAALTYAVKTSPNGVSSTTHELSAAWSWQGSTGLGWLHPGAAATWRPKGGGGLYTQVTAAPGVELGGGDAPDRLSVPVTLGVGWRGFYAAGSGDRLFGSAGLAFEHPFRLGDAHLRLRAELSGLFRDNRLRLLDPPTNSRRTVLPYAMMSIAYAR